MTTQVPTNFVADDDNASFRGVWYIQGHEIKFCFYVTARIPLPDSSLDIRGTIWDELGKATASGNISRDILFLSYKYDEESARSGAPEDKIEITGEADQKNSGEYAGMSEDSIIEFKMTSVKFAAYLKEFQLC